MVRYALAAILIVGGDVGAAAQEQRTLRATPSRPAPESDAAALAISRVRAANGLGPVTSDPALVRAAQGQANAMAASRSLSHNVAGDLTSRMRGAGFSFGAGAENLAQGQPSLAEAIEGWVDSPAHKRNLLMTEASRIGLARAATKDGYPTIYWALILASPQGEPSPTTVAKPALPFGLGRLFGR